MLAMVGSPVPTIEHLRQRILRVWLFPHVHP
jgi:hypothetical protein